MTLWAFFFNEKTWVGFYFEKNIWLDKDVIVNVILAGLVFSC